MPDVSNPIQDLEHIPLRLTCRLELAWNGEHTSAILQEISLKRLMFRSPVNIPVGAEVTVTALPTIQDEITFPVNVTNSAFQEEDGGRLQYYAVTALNARDTPDYWNFMRKLYVTTAQLNERIRIGCRMPVKLINKEGWELKGLALNVSRGGMFVTLETPSLPAKGGDLNVRFTLAEGPVQALAKVVHVIPPDVGEAMSVPAGIGLHFSRLDQGQEALFNYIDTQFRLAVQHQRHRESGSFVRPPKA